jgi:serine/threonine-protein kinase
MADGGAQDSERTPSPASWERLERLLADALARPADERAAFLGNACRGDAALEREIAALIEAHDRTEGPFDRLAADLGSGATPDHAFTDLIGRSVGPYIVVSEIGRGGMGVVYLARRADGQYDRDVALKVIQSRMSDRRERERFLAERQILARLSHPGIARLFDGGVTEAGLPYFTMEHVDGHPIDRYCDDRGLDVAARLRLFVQVCDAVAAAHRSLVVHRDLKPTNILVSTDGAVKLLDFGIAKPLDAASRTDVTRAGRELFTPDYASPEQVRGASPGAAAPMTTASDVYSLGTVLYELLTGLKPHRFTSRSPIDVERTICDIDASWPSRALMAFRSSAGRAEGERIGARRGSRLDQLAHTLSGDLDAIVMKALHKDPSRRYASVDLLRQDLLNYLQGLPVTARPDDWAYRTRKFVSRHRATVVAAALVFVSLTGGLVATMIQARNAREQRAIAAMERDRARAEAVRTARVSALLMDLFRLADPAHSMGESISAREILDRGTKRVETELAGDPETQAALLDAIGQVYRNLALFPDAEAALGRAVTLRRSIYGSDSPEVADSLHNLAVLSFQRNDYRAAEARFREALALRRRHAVAPGKIADTLEALGASISEAGNDRDAEPMLREALQLRRQSAPESPELMEALNALARVLHRRGDFEHAEQLFREAVEQGRRGPETVTPARVSSVLQLALIVDRFDRNPRAAEPLYREALGLARRLYPDDHPDVATCLGEMTRCIRDLGRLAEAETVGREALAMWRRLYGDTHREVMIATQTLAGVLASRGKDGEAERLFREALAMGESLFGPTHLLVLGAMRNLASFLEDEDRMPEAQALRERELAAAVKQFGDRHAVVARAHMGLGEHWTERDRLGPAEKHLRTALDIRIAIHPRDHWRIAAARTALGECLLASRRFDEAEIYLREGFEGLRASKDAPPEDVRAAREKLIALYEAARQPELAARYRDR